MAIPLAIETPASALGKADPNRRTRVGKPAVHHAAPELVAAPPIGAGDPAVAIRGPERLMPSAPVQRRRHGYGVVDALVTVTVMMVFAAALVVMGGELGGAPNPSVSPANRAEASVPVSPHVATSAGGASILGPLFV
jgi:hypothetical protein